MNQQVLLFRLTLVDFFINYMVDEPLKKEEEHFVPVGTIVFITLLLALTAFIWLSLYNLQLDRHY